MLMQKLMPRKLRGFTLTEAAIVLGIVGLILGAIWVAASAVYNNLRVSTTTTQILQMAQAIRSIHATQQQMENGVDEIDLARAGAIPKDMVDDPNNPATVRSIWNQVVTVAPVDVLATRDGFAITYESIPREPCSDLLVRLTGPGRDGGLVEAGVGTPTGATELAAAIGVTAATTLCASPTDNDLFFVFKLKG